MARGERVPEIVRQEIREALKATPRPQGLVTTLARAHQLSRMTINRISKESDETPPGSGSAPPINASEECAETVR